jgi:putative heme-binding domain-containing protein
MDRPVALLLPLVLFAGDGRADVAEGQKLFVAHCAGCHGPRGEGGRGVRLTTLTRTSDTDALFSIVRKGIPGTEMPPAPLTDREIAAVISFVRTLQRTAATSGPVSSRGRGEEVYRKAGCSSCHTMGTEGGILGPDLSNVGARRKPPEIRSALLDPDAEIPDNFGQYRWVTVIPDNFLQVRVVNADGTQITGARLNEDSFSIQVRDRAGKVHSFWKSDLKELWKDWGKSPMPSYREKLTAAELEDLITYLSAQQGNP